MTSDSEPRRGLSFLSAWRRPDSLAWIYLLAALALFAALAAYYRSKHGTPVVDDAYIAFSYARNLAQGAGLSYVGHLRVEGYTDFLWVLIVAAAMKLGLRPDLTGQALSGASGAALIACVWFLSQRHSMTPVVLRLAAPLLATLGPVAFWATSGLETLTFALLVLVGATLSCDSSGHPSSRRLVLAGFVFFMAALAHPDAVVWFASSLVFVTIVNRHGRLRQAAVFGASFGLPFAIYWLWRWSYFGDFFPNTFYAKSDHSLAAIMRGLKYVAGVGSVVGPISMGLVAAAIPLGLLDRPRNRLFFVLALTWLAYVACVGGDTLPMRRFLVPALPLVVLLLEESLGLLLRGLDHNRAVRAMALVVAACVAGSVGASLVDPGVGVVRGDGVLDASRVEVGKWLAASAAPNDVIAVEAAGAIPFFANLATIDMLGLNDRHIAHYGQSDAGAPAGHQRYDPRYVLSKRPAFVFMNSIVEEGQPVGPETRALPSISSLLDEKIFRMTYTRARLNSLVVHELVYIRNDRFADLMSRGLVSRPGSEGGD